MSQHGMLDIRRIHTLLNSENEEAKRWNSVQRHGKQYQGVQNSDSRAY